MSPLHKLYSSGPDLQRLRPPPQHWRLLQHNDGIVFDAEMDTLEGVLQTAEPQAQYKGLGFELGDEIWAVSLR
jgi:hypothetical protein